MHTPEDLAELESCYDCAGASCSTCAGEPLTDEEVSALFDDCAPFDVEHQYFTDAQLEV